MNFRTTSKWSLHRVKNQHNTHVTLTNKDGVVQTKAIDAPYEKMRSETHDFFAMLPRHRPSLSTFFTFLSDEDIEFLNHGHKEEMPTHLRMAGLGETVRQQLGEDEVFVLVVMNKERMVSHIHNVADHEARRRLILSAADNVDA